jgi:uncharacterized membrane protein YuzA (DUF378 family)
MQKGTILLILMVLTIISGLLYGITNFKIFLILFGLAVLYPFIFGISGWINIFIIKPFKKFRDNLLN